MKNFYESSKNNIESSLKVFEFSKKFSAPILYASSSAVYGNLPIGNDEFEKFSITSPYAQDKLSIEHYAMILFNIYKIPSIGYTLTIIPGLGKAYYGHHSDAKNTIKYISYFIREKLLFSSKKFIFFLIFLIKMNQKYQYLNHPFLIKEVFYLPSQRPLLQE